MTTMNYGAYRLLGYTPPSSPAPAQPKPATLKAVRQDAQALIKAYQEPAYAPAFSLPGLSALLTSILNWLSPSPTPSPQPPGTNPGRDTEFVISSFNVLGSSHTRGPNPDRKGMAPGVVRIRGAAELLDRHDVDVVGFQEFQPDQVQEFLRVAGDEYAVYPGMKLGRGPNVNSLAWRKDTWDLVKADTIPIPYFNGHPVRMPVVRLRHKVTGQEAYFGNFHNPASTKRHPGNEKWRDVATQKQVDLVNRLRQTGLPVFIVGDMNEREEYYQKMTKGAPMVAADTGPRGQAPKRPAIDWIFGTKDNVEFSRYVRDRSDLVERTSDHPMIVSRARIDG